MTEKVCYALYRYETLPYSEWHDWCVGVYLDKDEALAAKEEANAQAWIEKDSDCEDPDFLYDIRELPLYPHT
tara:strand:- start:349 stop:564 length:216 start_codon:yes stop_codon:yes gene_type:complete